MTPNEYQRLADRTASFKNNKDRLINGALGITGEAGKVADIIKKVFFQGHPAKDEDLIQEIGDVCWYAASLCTALDVDFEDVLSANIEKLRTPEMTERPRIEWLRMRSGRMWGWNE